MAGQLYVGNGTPAWAEYVLNNYSLTAGPPWSVGPTPTRYTPLFVTAGLTQNGAKGTLGYRDNKLEVTFAEEVGATPEPVQTYLFPIAFPKTQSLEDDVVSFAFRGWLLFANKSGFRIKPNPLVIEGEQVPSRPLAPNFHPVSPNRDKEK